MEKLKDFLVNLIESYPLISGLFMIVCGLLVFNYQYRKKESFRMSEHGLGSWKAFVNIWAISAIFFLWGLILIIRSV